MDEVEGIITFVKGNIINVDHLLAKDENISVMLKRTVNEETTMWLLEYVCNVTRYATGDNEIYATSVKCNEFSRSFKCR